MKRYATQFNCFLRRWYRIITFFLIMQLTGVFWFAIGQGGRVADVLRDSTKHTEDLTFAIIALTATQEKRTQVLNYIMYSDSIQNKNIDSLFFEVQMLKYKVHE